MFERNFEVSGEYRLTAMNLTYFKRFRMEIDLAALGKRPEPVLPAGYRWLGWSADLVEAHADAKYRSFRTEIDANVFPCLGDSGGCLRLMHEISEKDGFMPTATWLIANEWPPEEPTDYCGTIQGVVDRSGFGAIQNVGITPEHRGRGLGTALLLRSLAGFRGAGLRRVYLEVTAQNDGAIKLYERLGFRTVRTVYKSVEVAYT